MAKNDYVTTKTALTVQLKDGQSEVYPAGAPILKDDLADHVKERIDSGDEYATNLFESGGEASEDNGSVQDHRTKQMEEVEQISRERAALPIKERLGADPHAGRATLVDRTLPADGADTEADHRFAENENGADTSEALADGDRAESEDLSGDDVNRPAVSDAPRVVDDTSAEESKAPKKGRSQKADAAPTDGQ